jgi:hypothetical protein
VCAELFNDWKTNNGRNYQAGWFLWVFFGCLAVNVANHPKNTHKNLPASAVINGFYKFCCLVKRGSRVGVTPF